MKFECKKCGKCCKDYEDEKMGGISLFEWEKNKLEENARNLGINLNIKPFVIFRAGKEYVSNNFGIWGTCPFLINNSCSIYEKRPFTCKTFPIDAFGINRDRTTIIRLGIGCPALDNSLKEDSSENYKLTFLKNYLGKDLLLLSLQRFYTTEKLLNILQKIADINNPILYSDIPEKERENLIVYPLFTFCKKHNILSKHQIKSIIEDHNNLKDTEKFSGFLDSLD